MRLVYLKLSLACFFSLVALAVYGEEKIKIGYAPSLSGGFAVDSENEVKLVKLAEKQINAAGGLLGKKIEIVYSDNKSTPKGMMEAFSHLVEKEKVSAILTNSKSPQIVALAVIAKQAKLPIFIGGTSPKLTDDLENMFLRVRPDDDIMAAGATQFVKENTSYRKIGLLHDSATNGSSMANQQEKYSKELGELKVVSRVGYQTNPQNLKEIFEGFKKAGAEVVLASVATGPDGSTILKAAKEYESSFKILTSPAGGRKQSLKGAGSSANGAWVTTEYIPGTPELKKLSEAFKVEYNEEIDPFAIWIYDGLHIAVEGLKLANGDGKMVKQAILKKKSFHGVARTYDFDARGDGARSIVVAKVEDGTLVQVKNVEVKRK